VKRNQVLCGFGALMLAVAPAAHATLLSPGLANLEEPSGFAVPLPAIPPPDDRTGHNGTNPIGTLVASNGVETISSTGAGYPLTGSFISEVYEEASGTLDFYYQVSIAPGSTSSLEDLAVSGFLASSFEATNGVNVGAGGSVALFATSRVPGACGFATNPACTPVTLTGSDYADDSTLTGMLNLDWEGLPLSGGETSVVFLVSTNDAPFGLSTRTSVDGTGDISEDLFAFQPLSSVPEPVSLVLLGTTLALAALFIRRRRVVKASKTEIKS
jgi:hypothetical protein